MLVSDLRQSGDSQGCLQIYPSTDGDVVVNGIALPPGGPPVVIRADNLYRLDV